MYKKLTGAKRPRDPVQLAKLWFARYAAISRLILCTVPVPGPTAFAVLLIPTPFASIALAPLSKVGGNHYGFRRVDIKRFRFWAVSVTCPAIDRKSTGVT